MSAEVELQLGDIIQIIAPADTDINGHMYHIFYADQNKLRLVEDGGKEITLTYTDGKLDNEAIQNIVLKSRAEETGYARQNNLISGVWIDIYFNGDLPLTITGKITNLEDDKIEVTTFPGNDIIFIDFAYKGLPEDSGLEKIQIRKAPAASLKAQAQAQAEQNEPGQAEQNEPGEMDSLEKRYNEVQRQLLEIPEEELTDEALNFEMQKKLQEETRNYIFNADQIHFGEDLDAITQMIDVPEEEQRYDIDKQVDDLLDDMLSSIPNAQRTDLVKNNIHKMIQRFKQLRERFSLFDAKGYALMPKTHGANYKPLVGVMEKLEKQLYWMLPVVKCVKKMYKDEKGDDEEEEFEMGAEDTELIEFGENAAAEKEIIERYESNSANEGNKYAALQKELNPYLTPFLEPRENEDIIANLQVNTTITAVVDNLGDFKSSVDGSDTFTSPHNTNKNKRRRKIQSKRFALQTYTIGTTGLEVTKVRGENPLIKRKELTKSDRLDLKSLLMLPEPTVRFSQVNMQTPNILLKANLNLQFLNYWQLLRSKTHIDKTTIMNLDTHYSHEPEKFLNSFHNFMAAGEAAQTAASTAASASEAGTAAAQAYPKFLDTIIPKTKQLFELVKPHLTGKFSLATILAYLEPFMIYQDDLNETQYKDMNVYLEEKIAEYRKNHATKTREYANIRGTQNVLLPTLIKILDENTTLRAKVLDVYGFTDTIMNMSNADFIRRIYAIDNGVFYNTAIALISINLMIADGSRDMANIDLYLKSEGQKEAKKPTKGKNATQQEQGQAQAPANSSCGKYKVIAKRYIEIDELNDDNGKEIYFDKKYDKTNYEVGEMFKVDQVLPLGDQIKHYMGKLMKNNGMDENSARRDAEAIIKRKRTVENGEYAILETTDETSASIQYYARANEHWVLDDSIDTETLTDDAKMFCNLNEKCIAVKDKCEDESSGANELKKHNLKLLLAEFNTVLNVNRDIISNKIEDELASADARMDTLRQLRLASMYKYEMKKIAIGNTADETKKIVISPYDGLLNTLLGQTDMAKRYLDIANFVKAFAREGLAENNESIYWFYCIKSQKKMLPTFLYKLANTFLTGGNYGLMLDKICAVQGTISDDGDKYVDKYSGYTIKMIEMSNDEEYNEEGFKIISRSVMETDAGDLVLQNLPIGVGLKPDNNLIKRKYATTDATAIYNVIEALSTNMGLNLDDQKDFIVRNILKQLSNASVMPTKTAYDKLFATMTTKGKTIDTYEVAFNSTLLYLTFAYFLIAIQTSIPPIKTKTTFPGCKKSFSGFPIDGTDNMKGLSYVACVAFKIKNKAALPWSAIANRSEIFIAKQMEVNISKYILPTEEVQDNIKQLKLYLAENPESAIPAEHTIENWTSFLPPLKPLKMSITQDVGDVFKSRLSDSLRKGNKAQDDYIAELHSKMIMFSFNIIDLIEKTVHGEQAVLKGKNGEPFVENACCENEEKNTIRYFTKKQPEIAILNNKVVRLSDMYEDTKKLSKATILYDPSNTKRKLREIENRFSENTIYRAFIVYCRFNSLVPIGENLKAICPTKPENFALDDSLEESIRKLKSNARNYNEQSLQQLLEVINNSTKTAIKIEEKPLTTKNKLAEIMANMDAENKRPSVFRVAFMDLIESFELNALLEDTVQMRKFKNIVANLNEAMQGEITGFIGKFNTGVKKANLKKFKDCLATIIQFNGIAKETTTTYKMINFMKKAMRSLTGEFPNIIINAIDYDEVKAPRHWDLSQKHQMDVKEIIKGHYTEFKVFYEDAQIQLLMRKMLLITSDVNALAQNTIFYAPIGMQGHKAQQQARKSSDGDASAGGGSSERQQEHLEKVKYSVFDQDLTTMLFKFYFLNVLTDLISLQADREILQLPLTQLESTVDEEDFLTKANDMDILAGNQEELAEKIASVIVVFTNLICKDKSAIDYNYKGLMDLILRSKEKEKDDITEFLGKMTIEEREVENLFKDNKLERWSKGQQKGIHTYQGKTYDEEREAMEQTAAREVQMNKRSVVTDMNRDIFALDAINQAANDEEIDHEDNIITYMGEDAEPEDYEMDGDENY
jgi:hypothetical protein